MERSAAGRGLAGQGAEMKQSLTRFRITTTVATEVLVEYKVKAHVAMLIAVMTLIAGLATAQAPRYSVTLAPGQQERGARLGAPEMKLTLQDAIALALAHNIDIEVSRLDLASAGEGILGSTGIFDPAMEASAKYSDNQTASISAISNSSKSQNYDLSLTKFFPLGTSVSVGWANRRTAYSSLSGLSSSIFKVNPSYDSGLTFSASQGLLRGFGTKINKAGIEVARKNNEISRVLFEQKIIETIQQVEVAYWNLVYRGDNLKVKVRSLELAQELLDQTKTRVRIGTSAPIDIIQSEATVAIREQDIILAENQVEEAADNLKRLLGFELPEDWNSKIVPVEALDASPQRAELNQALEIALGKRLDLRQMRLKSEISEISLMLAKDAVKPDLGLSLGYGYSGAAGNYREEDPDTGVVTKVTQNWGDAWDQITGGDYRQWSAGLTFRYTFRNRDAKAKLAQRRFDVTSAKEDLAIAHQVIIESVRTAVRGIDANGKSVAAAAKARELAERNLDAEQKKFANGMSTNYQVLMIQGDLAAAQAAELSSRVSYRIAVLQYQVSLGTLLDNLGVEIKE